MSLEPAPARMVSIALTLDHEAGTNEVVIRIAGTPVVDLSALVASVERALDAKPAASASAPCCCRCTGLSARFGLRGGADLLR